MTMASESEARTPPQSMVRMDLQAQWDKQQRNFDQQQQQQQASHPHAVMYNPDYHSHAGPGLPMGCPAPQMAIHPPTTMASTAQVPMGSGTMQSQRLSHNHTFGEYPWYGPRMLGGGGEEQLPMMVPTPMMPGVLPYGMLHHAHPNAVVLQEHMFHPWAQGTAYCYQDQAGFGDPRGHAPWSAPPLQGAVSDAWTPLHRAADTLTRPNARTVRPREWRKRGADTLIPTASRQYSVDFGADNASDTPPQSTIRKGSGTQELPIPGKLRRIESDGHSSLNQSASGRLSPSQPAPR
jgi:hypothetical protein